MQIRFKPLPVWPFEPSIQSRSQFTSTWTQTLELLERELTFLYANEVIIQIGLSVGEIRLDGWPRADARPTHDGVILGFDSAYGHLSYATDQFASGSKWASGRGSFHVPGWQSNLRAIALSLEALRAVNRYGVSRRGEQYRGWAALTAGTGGPSTLAEAAAVVAAYAGMEADDILADPDLRKKAIKAARFGSHPDHGGTSEKFAFVQDAIRLLDS